MKLPNNVSESVKLRNPALYDLYNRSVSTDRPPSEGSESDLHNQIIEFCKARGWIYFHGRMDRRSGRSLGEPDFVVLAGQGRFLLVEAKTKNGKLSTEQLGMKMWAEKLGHQIYVVRSIQEFSDLCEQLKLI